MTQVSVRVFPSRWVKERTGGERHSSNYQLDQKSVFSLGRAFFMKEKTAVVASL